MGNVKDAKAIVAGHNKNITIQGIRFRNLNSGHFIEIDVVNGAFISKNTFEDSKESKDGKGKYTINMYHSNITIRNNKFKKTRSHAIRVMNWKNIKIENNEISNVARRNEKSYESGIFASGAVNLTIKNNIFRNMKRAFYMNSWRNTGSGSVYSEIKNKLTDQNMSDLKINEYVKVDFVDY